MWTLTEAAAYALAGDSECPVLAKAESEPMEAAVCLKQFPTCFVLGASDRRGLIMWALDERPLAEEHFAALSERMERTGTPLTDELVNDPAFLHDE